MQCVRIARKLHVIISIPMEHSVAVNLIKNHNIKQTPSRWTDLGAGDGTFTMALAELLGPSSVIDAVDRDGRVLQKIPSFVKDVSINRYERDIDSFLSQVSPATYDGILLANTLHFFRDQISVLKSIKNGLKDDGLLLIVEYDLTRASPWVPYPLSCEILQDVIKSSGFRQATRLRAIPSSFGTSNIYSALVE